MLEVSVVMSVFNGASSLDRTMRSILQQDGCDFELVVIDDGSTDATSAMLDAYAGQDARVRVVHQPNTGLTRALAHGCALARGRYIARHDCGDESLPGRLARQARILRDHPDAVMVGSATSFIGPQQELLYTVRRSGDELHDGLGVLHPRRLAGPPHHGATMFVREAYERAGGYRSAFRVAQDIDLWLRLWELGRCIGDPVTGLLAQLEAGGISSRRRADQLRLVEVAVECAQLRRRGEDEQRALLSAQTASDARGTRAPVQRAAFFYFVGCCLRKTDPPAARRYFRLALREHPMHLRSLVRLVLT
jgi:glycosyltransferase involved in cell wall biosynthesis